MTSVLVYLYCLLVVPLVYCTERLNKFCISNFLGVSGEPCLEYGFCSSCISNGCNWCEPTNRCIESYHECGINERLSSLDECSNIYSNQYNENPIVFTTDYSTFIAEKMSMYAQYVYGDEYAYEDPNITQWKRFDLTQIKMFKKLVTSIGINTALLFANIVEGYNLMDTIIPGYDGPNYNSSLYDKQELIDFVHSLDDQGSYNLPFADKLVDIFDEKLVIKYPESNVLGEHKVIIGIDDEIKGIIISFRGSIYNYDGATLKSFPVFMNQVNWDKSDVSELLKLYGINLSVKINGYVSIAYDTLKNTKYDNGISFFEYVMEYIEEYESYDIYITGHSMGAALSAVFTLDLYTSYYNDEALSALDTSKINIYTFGGPRVGNPGFALLLNKIFDYKYYRITSSNDPAGFIPPWIGNYRHNGIEIHYGEGDYQNGIMCQYRECTNLDPFEDPSCRSRYDDILFAGQDVIELTGQILNAFEYLKKIMSGQDIEGIEPIGHLANIIKLYMSETTETGEWLDHHHYVQLGEYGHCGSTVDHVKCEDHTYFSSVNTDNYKCLSLLSGIRNFPQSIDSKYSQIFEKLNGCYGAGDDMMCCMGGPHGPLTVCKEKEKSGQDWMGMVHFKCPANNVGEYCIINKDCIDEAMCIDGICILSENVNIENIVTMYIKQSYEIRYWLYELFGIKIDLITNLTELLDKLFQKLNISKSDDSLKEKIEKYAGKIKQIKQWIQEVLDIDIDSLEDICQTIQKWLSKISNDAIDDKIGNKICVDLQEKLKNIIKAIQKLEIVINNNSDKSKKEKSVLMIDFIDKNLLIYGLLLFNIFSSISFIFYCYIQHKRKQYRYQSVQPCSTDDENNI